MVFAEEKEKVKLIEITGKALSGEWGTDDESGDGIPVLRTTNFTNNGMVDYSDVVTRTIIKKNIADKYLRKGDIIIEKSGGSDKQPVGRVIFFEGEESTFLFNNFTGLLRVKDLERWLPRYIFYSLFANYRQGGTRQFENKTTGLHNLKTDDYISRFEVIYTDYEMQKGICSRLDKIQSLIDIRKKQIEQLDTLIKARFIELFGDVLNNDKAWIVRALSAVTTSRLGKMLDSKQQTGLCSYPYLANFNVQWFQFNLNNLNQMDFNEADQAEFELQDGDLLVCEGGEIGRCAVWHNQLQPCFFQKALHRVRCNRAVLHPDYLSYWFKFNCDHGGFSAIEGAKATISHLPGAKLKQLQVVLPPLELQEQFASFVAQVDKSKVAVQKSLDELQILFDSLMQEYFG